MKLQETHRKDGLRIITVSLLTQRKVYVELSARVGSAYDPEDKRGLFHFFEHMAFKGTKRRSLKDIQSFTQRNILSINAVTRPLTTSYYGISVYTKMKETCDFLCDIYCNSTFPKAELEKERRPILLEIARNNDNDGHVAFEEIRRNLWSKNPMRVSGGGTVEGVRAVQRADIVRERNKWHVPAATVAIAIGKVDHAEFVREINKHIPLNTKSVKWQKWVDEHEVLPKKQRVVIKKPKRNKAIVMLGFKIPYDLSDRTKECLLFCLEQLLSSGSGSRMYKEIREKRGFAYAVGGSFGSELALSRYFFAYVETSLEHVAEVEHLLQKAMSEPFTNESDFEEVRERSIDRATIGFDDNFGNYAELIWENISENRPVKDIAQYYSKYRTMLQSVSLKEVEAIRKEFFHPERFVTVVVEPR
ncbi:insulinase family protein [Candidatus Parcubacteria bacterium]|nr:insulinase family protein [Candidatus Parcubacteria bacterium]